MPEVLPDNTYEVAIEEIAKWRTKAGHETIRLKLVVCVGPFTGYVLYDHIMVEHDDERAVEFGFAKYRRILRAASRRRKPVHNFSHFKHLLTGSHLQIRTRIRVFHEQQFTTILAFARPRRFPPFMHPGQISWAAD